MAGSERSRDHLSYRRECHGMLASCAQVHSVRIYTKTYQLDMFLPHGAALGWISSCFGGVLGSYDYVAPLDAHAFPFSHCGKGECMGVHSVCTCKLVGVMWRVLHSPRAVQ